MNKTVKIAYFNYMQDLYGMSIGSTIKAEQLLSHLELLGYKICFYWRYADKPNKTGIAGSGKNRNFLQHPLLRRLFFTLKEIVKNIFELIREYRFLKSCRADLVIVRIDAFRYSASLLARILGLPLLIEADGANSWEWLHYSNKDGNIWKSWLLFVERFCFRLADSVFVQSKVAKDYYLDLYPIAADKITVITNGADPVQQLPDPHVLKEQLGINKSAVVCGFMGSLHYWHNTGLLFELVNRLLTDDPDLYFLIVGGGGPMTDDFIRQCSGCEWKKRVIFTGYIEHSKTPLYVNLFDIALAPYATSGLFYYSPVKIFEYMVQGKAIVTTRIGQIAELITAGESGLFFDPNSPGDLVAKVRSLLSEPAYRKRIGERARQVIMANHTWNHKAAQLEEQCLAALHKHGRG
ncbi:MAG TPA: glycosyltransferase family 4 protein [bacterium]|nr:glycosyltransferase family 4 protein [bacterium]HPN44940.1 glycosyltransferase family 4 protein [bacterium]